MARGIDMQAIEAEVAALRDLGAAALRERGSARE
jgi:hypothetical protein